MAIEPVTAWAVLFHGELGPWGNGHQFQYPIFFTRREAREWQRGHSWCGMTSIIRVIVKQW